MSENDYENLEPGDIVYFDSDEPSHNFTNGVTYIVRRRMQGRWVSIQCNDNGEYGYGGDFSKFHLDENHTNSFYEKLGMGVQDDN